MSDDELAPLRGLLDSVLNRLCAVEDKVGIRGGKAGGGGAGAAASAAGAASAEEESGGPHPALVAYDEHVSRTVRPFAESCDAVGLGPSVGPNVLAAWDGIRAVVELGTKCKRPPPGDPAACAEALAPYLEPVKESVTEIRTARLDRKFDRHVKAIVEMLAIASWPVVSPPSQPTPTAFVKESIGSSDFWSNKIRKEYKNRDDDASRAHIRFCDDMKRLILDLAGYTKEHHLSGLMWNPRGADVSEASVGGSAPAPAPAAANKESGGGMGDIVAELNKKKNADGTSAATGLKRVTRDQQTWRKEFDRDAAGAVPSSASAASKAPQKSAVAAASPKRGPPTLEYRDRGHKWAVENHTASTAAEGGVLDVDVTDPKQQVYIYRCESVTVRINGPKVKNVILDECNKVSCVFDTAISACEIVNCNKVQVQATGACPSFSIDKTDGCLVYLSGEAVETTGFVTSKSSEMNVSWEDEGGEVKEAPIPEQFQHRLVNGVIKSDVSDLYH